MPDQRLGFVTMLQLDWPSFCTTLQGFIGLDVLFVICGFLAAITLIPLLEDRRRPVKQARNHMRSSCRVRALLWCCLGARLAAAATWQLIVPVWSE